MPSAEYTVAPRSSGDQAVESGHAPDFVCASNHLSGYDATTGEKSSEAWPPVITATVFVDFWCAAEFTKQDYHRVIQQAAFFEVIQQGSNGLVKAVAAGGLSKF
jgi:hypothetical protein